MAFWKKKKPPFTVTFRNPREMDCALLSLLHTYAMVKTIERETKDPKSTQRLRLISNTIETIQRAKNSSVSS